MKNCQYTKKQIKEAIAHWTAVLESSIDSESSSSNSEAASWKVAWKDDKQSGVANFKTKEEADNWIKSREAQERYEPTGFEAEPPQKAASIATGIWDENGDGGPKDTASFIKVVCSLLKTNEWSFYEQFVPEQYDSFEGSRTAIDDWDTWKVNHQDTLSKKTFWEILYDECLNDDKILNGMPLAEFKEAVEAHAQEIADEAWENYEPDESVDILVSRGHRD